MKTQIFKTTLIVLMVSLFGQFQVNGANVNPYSTPEYKVKSAESRVSKYKKQVLKQEKAILRWEDQVDQGEKRLAKANGPISPLDAAGRPKIKIDWEIAATQKRIDIGSARSNLDSTKRSLRSSKEKLRADKRFLSNAEMELTKARARLVESEKKFSPAAIAERKAMEAEKTRKFFGLPRQTAQTNPQAPLNAPKLPFPFSSYDVWIKTGKILPGMTGLLHGENADGTFTDDRLSTIRDREAGRAYGYLTMPQNRIWILRWVARRPNGKKLAWTFGGNQRNLLQWKGQSARNVLNVFGKADRIVDEREQGVNGFQTTADWDYNVMNIRDSINGLHTRVRFEINNGVVQKIRLLD